MNMTLIRQMNKQLQKPQSFQEVATVGCIKEDIE